MSEGIQVVDDNKKEKKEITVPANTFVIISTADGNSFCLEANGDRVIIQEDKMRFGNECKKCDGEGVVDEPCPRCLIGHSDKKGTGVVTEADGTKEPCRACNTPRGIFGQQETQGYATCPDCNGKGGLLVIPQNLERRPTSGTIKSMGDEVCRCKQCFGSGQTVIQGVLVQQKLAVSAQASVQPAIIPCLACKGSGRVGLQLQVGDRVVYPIFAGTAINFKQKGTARIMHENEVMAKIYGVGNLGDIIK